MSKSLFDQLKEVNEEIKNIKKTTDNLKLIFKNSDLMDMSSPLEALKLFIQQSVKSQGEIKKYISDLSQRIDGLNEKIDDLGSKLQSGISSEIKLNEKIITQTIPEIHKLQNITPSEQKETYNIIKKGQKSLRNNTPESRSSILIAYPAPSPVTEIELKNPDDTFDAVYSAAKKKKGNELGKMIDEIRLSLSKKNPLNPILFELSMEAGRLKSLGESTLNDQDFKILEQKISSWNKSK